MIARSALVLAIIAGSILWGAPASAVDAGADSVLGMVYSPQIFRNVDVNDALAATKVWIDQIARETGIVTMSTAGIMTDMSDLVQSVDAREADVVCLPPTEFLELEHRLPLVPLFVGEVDGLPTLQYGIYARRGGGIQTVGELSGKAVVMEKGILGSLGPVWFGNLIRRESGQSLDTYVGDFEEVDRASQAVLQVFFGAADACVAALSSFRTMSELNPQLAAQLVTIAVSPPLCRSLVCLREDVIEVHGRLLTRKLLSLHKDARGRQLLTLFGLDRVVPFKDEYLDGIRSLLAEPIDPHRAPELAGRRTAPAGKVSSPGATPPKGALESGR